MEYTAVFKRQTAVAVFSRAGPDRSVSATERHRRLEPGYLNYCNFHPESYPETRPSIPHEEGTDMTPKTTPPDDGRPVEPLWRPAAPPALAGDRR